MKSSSPAKKASITLPAELEVALRKQAQEEKRSLSGIVQEASRYYLNIKAYEQVQRKLSRKARELGIDTEEDVAELVRKSRADR